MWRFSTATTPRVISCAEDHPEHVALPRGCRDNLSELLAGYNIPLIIEDKRNEGEPVAFRFQGRLTGMQEEAVKAILSHDDGVFVAPPGTGKTVVGAYLTAARGRNTLVLVHRKPILDQWVARLSSFPSPGKELWSNTQGVCTAIAPKRERYESTTTSTGTSRCWPGCSRSG